MSLLPQVSIIQSPYIKRLMAQAVLGEQVGLARGRCFLYWKKTSCLRGPRNSYSYYRVSVRTWQVNVGYFFSRYLFTTVLQVFSFSLVRDLFVIVLLPSSDFHRPFIEWQRQASCVLLFINAFCKCMMVSRALAVTIHLNHLLDSSDLYPFPKRKAKGEVYHSRADRGKAGIGSEPGLSLSTCFINC